jgi:hypothetical protein
MHTADYIAAAYRGNRMKSTIARFICRVLAVSLIVLPWQAQAGMIGTDQSLSAAQQRAAHAKVAAFIERDDVAAQLQQLGLSPQAARERVAALSDAEVAGLAGRIDALPAGGSSLVAIIVVVWLIVYFVSYSPGALTKESPKPAAKPAAKPAPEKK